MEYGKKALWSSHTILHIIILYSYINSLQVHQSFLQLEC